MIRVEKTTAGYQITVDVDDPIKPSLSLSRAEAWELLDALRCKLAEEHHTSPRRYSDDPVTNGERARAPHTPSYVTHRCGLCGLEKNENAPFGLRRLPPCTIGAIHAWDRLEPATPLHGIAEKGAAPRE